MIIPLLGWPGPPEITLIVVGILLLFGGKKIPEMMRGIGSGVKEFKKGIAEDEEEKKPAAKDPDKEISVKASEKESAEKSE